MNENNATINENDHSMIKEKIIAGDFKIKSKRGKSKVWDMFGAIENEIGVEFENIVVFTALKTATC